MKPLEPSSRAAALVGPNALMPAASRSSTMPAHQRRLRPDDDQVDLVALAERDDRGVVGDVERHAFRLARDAGIARRAIEPVGERACRHLPGQRVLAPARTEEENVHAGQALARWPRAGGTQAADSVHSPASTRPRRRGLLARMKSLAALLLLHWPGRAGRRRRLHARQPAGEPVFPGPKGGIVHISPYPAGKRAASVWASDVCWHDCTSSCAWKMETCVSTAQQTPTPAGRSSTPATAPASAPAARAAGRGSASSTSTGSGAVPARPDRERRRPA